MPKFEINATNIGLGLSILGTIVAGAMAFTDLRNVTSGLQKEIITKADIGYVQRIEDRVKESELFNKQVNEQIVELKIMLQVFIAEVRTERRGNKQ